MDGWTEEISPFHPGEQAMHERLGIRERQEAVGRRVMRRFMPQQHRDFYEQLPFVVLGSVDQEGAPWASVVHGAPGFVQTPNDTSIRINAHPLPGDPLNDGLASDAPVSLLGIEPHTRRRNRANLRVNGTDSEGMTLRLTMSFGNCPQYIQTREVAWAHSATDVRKEVIASVSADIAALIREADTFFVASHNNRDDPETIGGVDVNHRGGKPGFVRVEGNTLTIPDFRCRNGAGMASYLCDVLLDLLYAVRLP
jgi:predicted pyridoxine 5'-phosphate oxidase superfamily flavin-nucleotide-binding protein